MAHMKLSTTEDEQWSIHPGYVVQITLSETNIAPENGWLED